MRHSRKGDEMTTDAIQQPSKSKAWWAVKAPLLIVCLFVGLKALESFLVYSFQAGGLSGLSGYRERYDVARAGQLLTLAAFLASQVLGGAMLRGVVATGAASWGERIKSVLLFSLGFALVTGLVAAVIVALRR
jgi:hypothetical protein